jgi:endonuclease/exonuclease/phosphatase family metal-dependent hydrolase
VPAALALFVALCASAIGEPAAPPPESPRTTLTVAAFNIENLFDVWDDPYTSDEGTDVKPREELEKIAATIRKLNADVIGLSEVENEGVLKSFVAQMLGDMGYKHVAAAASNDGRGIRTAVVSRLPIRSITSYRFLDLKLDGATRTWRFARDLMHVQLEVSDKRTAHAFVVHLKSMRDDGDDKKSMNWRTAEALMARKIIDGVQAKEPGAWVVMLGDFNSLADTPPMKALTDDAATGGHEVKPLIDLHAHVPLDTASYLKKPYRSRIDYILANEPLAKRVVKESAKVVEEKELAGGSDHAPVVATFDVKE